MSASFRCRSCSATDLRLVVDLGDQPLANNLLRVEDLGKPEPRFPLAMHVCRSCWLMQISQLVPPVTLFSEYVYFSSFSDAMVAHARDAAQRYITEYGLGPQSFVIEVASNDGYLLQNFVRARVPCLGIEPAANVAAVARENGIESLVAFFGRASAEDIANSRGQADLVLGNNVFAHAPDINDFVAGLARVLAPRGRTVLEFPYALPFLENVEFDTIYHEHVFYFSLTALLPVFRRHNLEVFDVERLSIHGGSLRLFAGHRGAHARRASVDALLEDEKESGIDSDRAYAMFAERVEHVKSELLTLLARLRSAGRRIAAYGASAKGSTLLNYVRPPEGTLEFVADRSVHKHGKLTPGLHLPIVPADALAERRPDYTLLLTWNFAEEIIAQQSEYRRGGGKFIMPIPRPVIAGEA